jgi:Fe2+ transport system protein B
MEYLGDTNIYRNLVRGLSITEVKKLAEDINAKEIESDIKSGVSIIVAMELINHLREGDLNFDECYKALCLLYHHSKKKNIEKEKHTGTFYPPLDIVLTSYFFNENTQYLRMYSQVLDLTVLLTENYNVENVASYSKQIETVREQLIFDKDEIRTNYENYLKSINEDVPDWEYFKKSKTHRREWFKTLQSGKTSFLVAEGLMIRAFSLTDRIYSRTEENFEKLIDFINQFYPAIIMNELILEQLGHGNILLGDVEDGKWNTINDMSIMFGMLLFSDRDNKVLVTEDKAIRKCLNDNGMGNKLLSLSEFELKMGIKTV